MVSMISHSSPVRPILLVEDDNDIAQTVREVLEDEGYRVVRARNGADALQLLRRGPGWSVILLDLMMPVMDGWDFRARQLAAGLHTRVPLVVLSGAGQLARRTEGLRAHAVMDKPFQLLALIDVVERLTRVEAAV